MEPPRGFCELLECFNANHVSAIIVGAYALGFGDVGLSATDFQRPDVVIQLGVPPVRVDLLTGISGVTWEEAWGGQTTGEFGGVPVAFIGLAVRDLPLSDEPCLAQHAQMARHGRSAHREERREVAGRALAATQRVENGAAGRIGDRVEDGVGLRNHRVTYRHP